MEKDISSKSKAKRILLRAGFCLLGILLVLFIAIAIVLNVVVTPEKITPVLLKISKEYVDGDVRCESVDITFFSTFPNLGIKLLNGSISSETDTLLAFEQFTAALNPLALLFKKQVVIRQLEIENADIYAHVDASGKANWDIFTADNSATANESAIPDDNNVSNGSIFPSDNIISGENAISDGHTILSDGATPDNSVIANDSTTLFVLPELNINNIRLRNVNLTYDDVQQDLFVMIDSLNTRLRGSLSKKHAELNLGLRTSGITAYYQGQTFARALPFSFRTTLVRDRELKTLTIERGIVKVGSLEFKSDGTLKQHTNMQTYDVDVDFSLNTSSLAGLVEMIPEHLSDLPSKLVAGGEIESNGKLSGQFGKDKSGNSLYPLITLSLRLIDGTLASTRHPAKPFIEALELDFNTLLDISGETPSSLELKNLYLQTASSKLTVKGAFDNLLTNPAIRAQIQGDIDFTQIAQKLSPDSMTLGGRIDIDASAECLLTDILSVNIGKIKADGVVRFDDVTFIHAGEQLNFYTSNILMTFGTNARDSVGGRVHESLLRSKIVLDTLNLNHKEALKANSSRISILVSTSEPKDTGAIAPVTVGSRISNIRFAMGDSIRLRGKQLSAALSLRPKAGAPNLPEISGNITIDSIIGRMPQMSGNVSKAILKLNLAKQPQRQRNARRTGASISQDSIQTTSPGETLQQSRRVANRTLQDSTLMASPETTGQHGRPMGNRTAQNPVQTASFSDASTETKRSSRQSASPDSALTETSEERRNAATSGGMLTAQLRDSADERRPLGSPGGMLTRAQRDSIRRNNLDPTTNLSFQIESQETKELLRNWDIAGSFSSSNIRVRTPLFPIPIRMQESDMTFTGNTLKLKKAHVLIGQSDFKLNGEIEGIRRALMFNDKLQAKLTLEADSLDINELIRAAAAGSEFSVRNTAKKDSIPGIILQNPVSERSLAGDGDLVDNGDLAANESQLGGKGKTGNKSQAGNKDGAGNEDKASNEASNEDEADNELMLLTEDSVATGVFVIPRNLDVEFNARIRNGKFGDINIRNTRGRVILRDQAVQLPRFTLNTDIGSTSISLVYKASNPKGAHLGVELDVRKIDLKELIGTLPIIVEMAPMLNSFEGVVDCNITAITELDSLMNVRLEETSASCYLSGQQLVLLDGETFAEISKMLLFKNKDKNRIDSMSVEMILEDEKLMIFPFQLTMDRYNVAVGGVQNLDLSFDYHITVLKSPIPFKLGVNISGTPDKMKIRLGKAKYKDMFTVARKKELDETINLRKEMDEKLRQSIQEIAGMELTQPMRRPRMALPDSLKRNFFQLEDTTAVSPLEDTSMVIDSLIISPLEDSTNITDSLILSPLEDSASITDSLIIPTDSLTIKNPTPANDSTKVQLNTQ